jgi:hypothetical protein
MFDISPALGWKDLREGLFNQKREISRRKEKISRR